MDTNKKHFVVLDYIRGLAASAVCLFHFTLGDILTEADPVRIASSFGRLGVEAFFVVSGFVISYAMIVNQYALNNLPVFLLRRLIRIYPPYLVAVVLSAVAAWLATLSPLHKTGQFPLTATQVIAHFAYLNSLLGWPWINGVFWTLAIELQYYALMALVFPILNFKTSTARTICLFTLGLCGMFTGKNDAIVFHWLPIFTVGIAIAMYGTGRLSKATFVTALTCFVGTAVFVNGTLEAGTALLTGLAICWWQTNEPTKLLYPLKLLGAISYSLYLVHMPVGRRAINFSHRYVDTQADRYLAILFAVVVSLFFATVLWYFLERPIQRWLSTSGKPALSNQETK